MIIYLKNKIFELRYFKSIRLFLILFNDLLILNLSLYFSYFLRIEYFIDIKLVYLANFYSSIIYLILFYLFNIQKQYFRHFNPNSYYLYFKFFLSYVTLFGIFVLIQKHVYIPRSLIIIFPIFFLLILTINRALVSIFFKLIQKSNSIKTIVFGFSTASAKTLSSYLNIKIFIDDNKNNQKREFNDIKILSSSQFKKEINSIEFSKIIILDEKVFNKSKYFIRSKIINEKILVQKIILNNNEITTKPYFDFNFFFNRKSKINALSNIYTNKIILITGAGGSIGSNIVYQLMKTKFKMLFLLDNSEYNLYNLSTRISSKRVVFSLNNFNDKPFMDKLLSNYKFDAVFHAAAFKHVPLTELNPFSAIKNNFINTYWFITQVMRHRVPYFCLVSSDKAVRPTNIMGASKRLAELSLIYLNKSKSNKSTIFNSVRFGNVINSSGSVMPLFMRQIQNNQSLTLTHKKITRYFMTIEEAANLVLNVYKISKGGEVFLLDMGMPIKLLDLAKLMIQFSGKTIKEKGNGDIEIKIIGLRKGEKLYEELLVDEKSIPTKINSIHQSLEKEISNNEFKNLFLKIQKTSSLEDLDKLYKLLKNDYINFTGYEK